MLDLILPLPCFDVGSFEVTIGKEIILFGGFSDGPIDKVMLYKAG